MIRICRKWEDSWKTRFHDLELVSKMRLLKTHSPTPEQLDYEAKKERQVKRERNGTYPKQRENVNGNHRHVT